MPALVNYDKEGVLTLNGVSFNTPAWSVGGDEMGEGSLLQLWGLMAERFGEDRRLPNANGVIAYPKFITVTPYDLRILVIGDVNSSGVPYADDRVGLQTNMNSIKAVIDTVDDGTSGTVTATLTRFTGSPITAPVHVKGLRHERSSLSPDGYGGSYLVGTLQLSIPTGRLA